MMENIKYIEGKREREIFIAHHIHVLTHTHTHVDRDNFVILLQFYEQLRSDARVLGFITRVRCDRKGKKYQIK